ncbi:MAG: hypothetical protein OEV40_24525 [Acidimicrobiia bacterium]|nr:hypothetical protein [Acidimicrobiia bacterium]
MAARRPSRRRIRRLTSEEVDAYHLISADLSQRVWVVRIPDLPGPYAGLALGRFVFLAREVPPSGSSLLLAHELVHVRQWAELGIAGFLFRYLRDFSRGLKQHRNWQKAYRQIDAEEEARRLVDQWAEDRSSRPAASGGAGPGPGLPPDAPRSIENDPPT